MGAQKTINHGHESQSKLWKKFASSLRSILPSAVSRQSRDSTNKFQSQMTFRLCTSFLKFESHNKIKYLETPIALEGLKLIVPLAVLSIVCWMLGWPVAGTGALTLTLFMLFFFRNPSRRVPPGDQLVVSPADGKIVAITDVREDEYLHQDVRRVSIFLSVFNVHVNCAPVGGTVETIRYNPGKFHVAAVEKASLENEQSSMVMAYAGGRILVKQIAGILARRIICYVQPGDILQKGDRYGLICFGSRVDIFLPPESEIKVKLGDKVKGGADVIAVLKF